MAAFFMAFMLIIGNFNTIQNDIIEDYASTYQIQTSKAKSPTKASTESRREAMLKPVVRLLIELDDGSGLMRSAATGFSIYYNDDKNISYILTNDHFCEVKGNGVWIQTSESFGIGFEPTNTVIGKVIKTNPRYDLCLISVPTYITPIEFAPVDYKLQQFEELYIVGAPQTVFPIILKTYFSVYIPRHIGNVGDMTSMGNDFILVSEEIRSGHSGSPIFNSDYKVVGIIFAGFGTYGGEGILVADIVEFLKGTGI